MFLIYFSTFYITRHVELVYSFMINVVSFDKILQKRNRRCSTTRKPILKNFAIFTGKHLCWSLFLSKLQAVRPAILSNTNYNTGIFLWMWRNFQDHLFWEISANGCFSSSRNRKIGCKYPSLNLIFLVFLKTNECFPYCLRYLAIQMVCLAQSKIENAQTRNHL